MTAATTHSIADPGAGSLAFLAGGGRAAEMIRARDWSDHPLGPPESWPAEFRAALSLVLNSPESMILAWGPDLHLFFNDTYFPLLGPRLAWAMGARLDQVWADAWEQAKPIVDEAIAGRPKRFVDLPWMLDTDRGPAETWWTFSYSRVLDAEGAFAGLFIFTNETTERVRTDAARRDTDARLRESEDHFRHTVELNPQVPWTSDPQGNITSYSKRWLELTGQAPGEPLGQGWSKALHPDDLAPTIAVFSGCLASGEPVDVDYRIRVAPPLEGFRWMRARAYPRRDEIGAIVAWYGVVEDVHDRKLAEAALRESEAFLQRVLASSTDCIKVLDLDGNLIFMSEGGLLALEVEDFAAIAGRPWPDFWPDPRNADAKAAVAAARAGGTGEFRGLAPSMAGTPRWWDVRVTPILGADGRPERLLAVSRDITEQRTAQDALGSSEARYRTLFESMDEGFCVIEFLDGPHGPLSDYVHVEANPAYARQSGIPDVVGQRVRDMVPDEAAGWVELYGSVLRSGEPIRFERDLVATGRHLELAAFRVEPASRRQVAVLFKDITGEARTRERYRLAIEATQVGIFDYNLVTDELVWDARVRELFGVGPDAPVTYEGTFLAGLHPDDRERADAAVQAALDPQGPGVFDIAYRVRAFDTGDQRWIAARGQVVVADGRTLRFVGTVRDITAAWTAQAALRELNETLEEKVAARTKERNRIWQLGQDLLLIADSDGRWLSVNPAWTRSLGWVEHDLVGRTSEWLEHPDDREKTRAEIARLAQGHTTLDFENRFRAKDGSYRHLAWKAVSEAGLLYCSARDVTQERERQRALERAQEELRQSHKMEAVGQLTGGIAHDFNNLLAGICGSLELMNTRIGQGRVNDVDKYMAAAQGAAKRAAALTHRLLAFSRRQTLDPRPTNVNALVAGMEDLVRRTVGPSVAIEVVGASGLWACLVDPPQLENALLNLCINARDAMPNGGRMTIETANKWLDRSAARRHQVPEGQYLSLCVTDTGTGMSPDVIAKAFDPFFTTKPIGQGTGLGLSMIYGFANQSGGQVRIYSEVGQGTTVCLYLPRYRGDVQAPDPLAERIVAARTQEGETVLVVDDEPTVRMLVTEVLEELGYTAIEAADSVAGLKVLQSDVRIDLLVTDVGLPGGMNGRQMADAGRERRPALKVLFVTGYAENAVIGNGHLEPGMQVLTKPFAVETLGARIRELVAG